MSLKKSKVSPSKPDVIAPPVQPPPSSNVSNTIPIVSNDVMQVLNTITENPFIPQPLPISIPAPIYASYNEDSCGQIQAETISVFIIRGTLAYLGKWPWMVGIEAKTGGFCGGSLISNQHVLTAAHCQIPVGSIVTLGQFDRSKSEPSAVKRTVIRTTIHENYNKENFSNDISVLLLDLPVVYNRYISPICLSETDINIADVPLTVIGWGVTESGTVSNPLLETIVYKTDNCDFSIDSDKQYCCGSPKTSSGVCFGDSGGPLMYKNGKKWTQVGLVSFGQGSCSTDSASVYTKVVAYLPWIQSKLLNK
jgi:secreted trypsin-like serine protease